MARQRGRGAAGLRVVRPVRLARADRRADLLDAATQLIVTDGVEAVSMEAVADRAGVSRPLVYKHFGNRSDILVAVFRREAERLHVEIAAEVRAAHGLEATYRALVRGSIRASSESSPLFAALRSAGAWNPELRREREARDRRTVQFFAERTSAEYGIPAARAEVASAMLLTAIESVLVQWRTRQTRANAGLLEETYLDIILGGLERMAERAKTGGVAASR